jgi:hypothetical protein
MNRGAEGQPDRDGHRTSGVSSPFASLREQRALRCPFLLLDSAAQRTQAGHWIVSQALAGRGLELNKRRYARTTPSMRIADLP